LSKDDIVNQHSPGLYDRNERRRELGTCSDKSATVWIPIETLAGGGAGTGPATILARYRDDISDNHCKVGVPATTLATGGYGASANPCKAAKILARYVYG
jgi:hypothetical protein